MGYEILKPEQKHKIKGVLFDMDGLVLDTEVLYTRFWTEAANEAGYPMTREQALGMRSLNKTSGQKYLQKCFGHDISYDQIRSIRIRRMNSWIEKHGVLAKPGICQLLNYLDSCHIPCAVTSSSPLERIHKYLSPLGLADRFNALCSGYEVKHGKPEPDIYIYGASVLHLQPFECLALEDSPAGIESAFRAGCLPVVIPDQDQPSVRTLEQSFAKADSLSDICGLIKKLNI